MPLTFAVTMVHYHYILAVHTLTPSGWLSVSLEYFHPKIKVTFVIEWLVTSSPVIDSPSIFSAAFSIPYCVQRGICIASSPYYMYLNR